MKKSAYILSFFYRKFRPVRSKNRFAILRAARFSVAAFLPAVIWMAFIFSFSAAPAVESSETSDGISYKIVKVMAALPFLDWEEEELEEKAETLHVPIRKAAHFSEYALLAVLWAAPFGYITKSTKKRMAAAFLICLIYAVSDEIHQLFVPGRDGNVKDVLIDSAGAGSGILLWRFLFHNFSCRRRAKNSMRT